MATRSLFRCRQSRKAQVELVGLVIIVILLTLGMLFLAIFALKENPEKKIFTRKGLASSTVSALMKTTVDDPQCIVELRAQNTQNIVALGRSLLEDCAENYPAGTYVSRYQCGGKHSCIFVQDTFTTLLQDTLGQWNKKYELKVTLLDRQRGETINLIEPIVGGGGCPPTRDRDSSGLFPLSTSVGIVETQLLVCD